MYMYIHLYIHVVCTGTHMYNHCIHYITLVYICTSVVIWNHNGKTGDEINTPLVMHNSIALTIRSMNTCIYKHTHKHTNTHTVGLHMDIVSCEL